MTFRCKLFGHKLRDDASTSQPVFLNGSLMGYDLESKCVRRVCGYVAPLRMFYGAETPWAMYLEPASVT